MLALSTCLAQRVAVQILHRHYSKSIAKLEFMQYLKGRITASGPISISTYMQEALTNPKWGYYMNKDVFGTSGDFITSPEISQMFGEMVGIWLLNEWLQAKQPKSVRLVELGPGRGTLMADILRVFNQLKLINESLSIHLIEVSQEMRRMQRRAICGDFGNDEDVTKAVISNGKGAKVYWHDNIKDVPSGYTLFLAHEFFDALPVHLFRKTSNGWREVLVDASSSGLQFVLAPGGNPLSELLIPKDTELDEYEICPAAGVIIEHMSNIIESNGGSSLIIDYGKDGPSGISLRSFKNHELVENILEHPGTADITANVDFSFLKRIASKKVQTYGPVTQSKFLKALGIETRYKALVKSASEKQRTDLNSSLDFLLNEQGMGTKFKVLALNQIGSVSAAGF